MGLLQLWYEATPALEQFLVADVAIDHSASQSIDLMEAVGLGTRYGDVGRSGLRRFLLEAFP